MTLAGILARYATEFLGGLSGTFKLAAVIWSGGLVFGGIIGVFAARHATVGWCVRIVAFALSGLPALVLLFWLHYPLQAELHVVINPFYTAAAAFMLLNTAGVAEIVRGGLALFPRQYLEAARVCGLSRQEALRHIEIPIVLRDILPPLLNLQVVMLQSTLFASLIGVNEIFRSVQRVNAEVQQPIIVYSTLAVFILVVSLPINGIAIALARRFRRDYSER
jgi:His/Glu/Gln/Arg/opine family amino acid ABC transporter permease subunit